jgi:5-oxoprolinase (ATP-hydrolysing) subunit A
VRVDLNCDLGEGGEADAELIDLVSSVSVACGVHAGSPGLMRQTVERAARRGVAVGAHPGLADVEGAGRREMSLTPDQIHDLVLYQIGALAGFARASGVRLQHVKLHGALYHMACRVPAVADAVVAAVVAADRALAVFGLPGSELERAARAAALRFAAEAFADRTYRADGSLTPRDKAGAFLVDPELAARRVLDMLREGHVPTIDGPSIAVRADTVCLHGDNPAALTFARRVVKVLGEAGVQIRPLRDPVVDPAPDLG